MGVQLDSRTQRYHPQGPPRHCWKEEEGRPEGHKEASVNKRRKRERRDKERQECRYRKHSIQRDFEGNRRRWMSEARNMDLEGLCQKVWNLTGKFGSAHK